VDADGERYYRSGDLGCFTPEGLLYHKGRRDCQVKVRGIRVDLGEIESALHNHPAIKEAVVVGRPRHDGDTELVSYIRLRPDGGVGREDLYTYLAARLSPHQVPTRTVFVDSFPLTRTNKVDRNALPEPEPTTATRDPERAAPRDETEARLFAIWADVLGHR
jgi:acyl-coenzyme A synthetase/AMP-(fatty) acid ligase